MSDRPKYGCVGYTYGSQMDADIAAHRHRTVDKSFPTEVYVCFYGHWHWRTVDPQ